MHNTTDDNDILYYTALLDETTLTMTTNTQIRQSTTKCSVLYVAIQKLTNPAQKRH